jgi:hypothetical protein
MVKPGTAHKSIAGWALITALSGHSGAQVVRAQSATPADAFYAALHGDPAPVDAVELVGAPGRFVGRPVKTTGRLMAVEGSPSSFELGIGKSRLLLRLEPETTAVVAARSTDWAGQPVVVEGLFYREADVDGREGAYAMRAWLVRPVTEPPRRAEPASAEGARVSLQDLVYGAGRFDGRLIRVRGSYRGSNRHADLPERTRKGRSDWVIKDGYFAAWVTGREARGDNWDLTQRSSSASDAVVEIVGVPATSGGVVRIQAREVALSTDFVVGGALGQPRDAGLQAVSPRVSFAWPIPGDALRRRGQMILQFSKPLDPPSLEGRVRVRYGAGATTAPAVTYEYRQRYRALVVLPEPPPPPGADVVVELLEGIIDIDGRALAPALEARDRGEPPPEGGVVDRVRFRSAP